MKKLAALGVGILVGASSLCGATVTTLARAELPTGPIFYRPRPIANCANAPADRTLNWGANQATAFADSGTNYGHPGCDAFIVDVNVTPATGTVNGIPGEQYISSFSLFGDDPLRDGGVTSSVPQAECSAYVEQVIVYKHINGGFAQVAGGFRRGVWSAGLFTGCYLAPEAGYTPMDIPFNVPSAGTDTYRIAVSVHLGTAVGHTRAGGTHMLRPPS